MQSLIHPGRTLAMLAAVLLLAGPAAAEPVGFLAEAQGTVCRRLHIALFDF